MDKEREKDNRLLFNPYKPSITREGRRLKGKIVKVERIKPSRRGDR